MKKVKILIINWGADESQIERVKSIISESGDNFIPEYVEMDIINAKVTDEITVLVVIGNKTLQGLANNFDDCYVSEKKQLAYLYSRYHRRWTNRFFVVANINWKCYLEHYYCMNVYAIVSRSYVSVGNLRRNMQSIYEEEIEKEMEQIRVPIAYCDGREYSYDNEFENIVSSSDSNSFACVFAPEKVKVSDYLLVQVYIYKKSNHNIVVETAKRSDDNNTKERQQVLLDYNINKGDIIDVTLDLYPEPEFFFRHRKEEAILMGEYALASFEVLISHDFECDKIHAKVLISVNEATICQMNFATKIIKKSKFLNNLLNLDYRTVENPPKLAKITSHCFKKVFVSYSHKDVDKVKFIAEAYRAIGVDYFYDRHSLRGGDVFDEKIQEAIQTSDLFILCWSANAAQSNYIKKEIDTALPLAYPQIEPQEAAPLSIYPISIEPYAPPPENMKSIYNFEKI